MSLTIQQIITDAKRLAGRLKERDNAADILLNETHAINKRIDAMKQYQEEVEHLNEVAHQKPHSQLIANIQKENRHLREIQQENRELRAALEEHQIALEHIMSKYRQHAVEQLDKTRVNFSALQGARYTEIICNQAQKISEMAEVMRRSALLDENHSNSHGELITALKSENDGLKEMLQISTKYGSASLKNSTEDKNIQTDSAST